MKTTLTIEDVRLFRNGVVNFHFHYLQNLNGQASACAHLPMHTPLSCKLHPFATPAMILEKVIQTKLMDLGCTHWG